MKKKILISTSTFAQGDDAALTKLIHEGYEPILNPYKRKLTKPETISLLGGVEGLIAGLEVLDTEVMRASCLKVISRVGAGVSNVDLEAARKLKIKVFSTPDAPTSAVAELTIGMMFCLLRNIPFMNSQMHQGHWEKAIGNQLEAKFVAVIGYGRIGRMVAGLLQAFNASVICVDPAIKQNSLSIRNLPLLEALALADIVTIHVSGDSEILGEKEFSVMKKRALLLNAARGTVVNEEALIKALDQNRIAGAWLDTFSQEPYIGKLTQYSQILMTPHVGSLTFECRKKMEMEAVENLLGGLKEFS
ncbi:MAG: NAD(P)-dependent oxidoreductase [Candidatus Omnitrophota bacterium]|nr:NAD(P)-dependent oxidoreductase [Candidatus Omnitrophota bacterium]